MCVAVKSNFVYLRQERLETLAFEHTFSMTTLKTVCFIGYDVNFVFVRGIYFFQKSQSHLESDHKITNSTLKVDGCLMSSTRSDVNDREGVIDLCFNGNSAKIMCVFRPAGWRLNKQDSPDY